MLRLADQLERWMRAHQIGDALARKLFVIDNDDSECHDDAAASGRSR
jgi:hypothetical protein